MTYAQVITKELRKSAILTARLTLLVFLVCFSMSFTGSLIESFYKRSSDRYGKYDVCIFNATADNCHHTDVEEQVGFDVIGYIEIEGKSIRVGSLTSDAMAFLAVTLSSGALPAKENEILIEEHIPFLLESNISIGDTVTIPFQLIDGSVISESFSVSGFINDYTYRTPEAEDNRIYGFPSIIVSGELSRKLPGINHSLIKTGSVFTPSTKEFPDTAAINTYKFSEEYSLVLAVFCSIALLTSLMGFTTVIAYFFLTKEETAHKIFTLKCSGVSWTGCMRFRLSVLAVASTCACVLGIVSGIIVTIVAVYLLGKSFAPFLNYHFSPLLSFVLPAASVLIVLIIALVITVKLVDDLPVLKSKRIENNRSSFKVNRSFFLKRPLLSRAVKTVRHNSDVFLSVIISSFLIFFVSIISQLIISGIVDYSGSNVTFDYRLSVSGGSYFSAFEIPYEECAFSEYAASALESCHEIKSCFSFSKNKMFVNDERLKEKLLPLTGDLRDRYSYSESAEKQYNNELIEFGYNEDSSMMPVNIFGVNEQLWNYLTADESHAPSPKNGLVVIYGNRDSPHIFDLYENIVFTAPRQNANSVKTVFIDAIVTEQLSVENNPLLKELFGDRKICFAVRDSILRENAMAGTQTIFVYLSDSDSYSDTERIIDRISSIYSKTSTWKLTSHREENENLHNTVGMLLSVVALTIAMLLIISLTAVYSVVHYDFSSSKRIWGYLRALSLNRKQAYQTELLSFLVSTLLGAGLALFTFFLIVFCSGAAGVSGLLSQWKPAFLIVPALVLTIACSLEIYVLVRTYWKKSVIDLLSLE